MVISTLQGEIARLLDISANRKAIITWGRPLFFEICITTSQLLRNELLPFLSCKLLRNFERLWLYLFTYVYYDSTIFHSSSGELHAHVYNFE